MTTILILGGYGNTGLPLARLLLQETDTYLVLAGRNKEKAKKIADELNTSFNAQRVRGGYVDAADGNSLRQALEGMDFAVIASSTVQYSQQIIKAVIEAKAGYLDIQYSLQKNALLKSMEDEINRAGCCFITDGGFHPGLPAFLVRYAAQYFDQILSARVGSVIKEDWKSIEVADSTVIELLELMKDYEMQIYKDGRWKKAGLFSMSDYLRMDFGDEFGEQFCAPMLLEEMRLLPQVFPSLTETGFYVGSFNWFTDWIIMPVALLAMKLFPNSTIKPMARWMHWGLNTFSKPPFGTILKVEAAGEKDGQTKKVEIMLSHPDGYMFTAIPVAACIIQWLDGTINKPGVWFQAHIVEPTRFMSDMQQMGIVCKTNEGV